MTVHLAALLTVLFITHSFELNRTALLTITCSCLFLLEHKTCCLEQWGHKAIPELSSFFIMTMQKQNNKKPMKIIFVRIECCPTGGKRTQETPLAVWVADGEPPQRRGQLIQRCQVMYVCAYKVFAVFKRFLISGCSSNLSWRMLSRHARNNTTTPHSSICPLSLSLSVCCMCFREVWLSSSGEFLNCCTGC